MTSRHLTGRLRRRRPAASLPQTWMLAIVLTTGMLAASLSGQSGQARIELISVTPGGTAGGGQTYLDDSLYDRGGPSHISADNRFVVFTSASDQLVAGDSNARQDIFVRDRQTGITTIVSVATNGSQANGHSGTPVISADGRYVAFTSLATNLAPGDTNDLPDLFVRDLQTGTTVLASGAADGTPVGAFYAPAISADGRYVAFASQSNILVPGDTNVRNVDVFRRDLLTGTTERVSLRPDGSQIVGGDSIWPSISADGSRIAFGVADSTLAGPTPQVPSNLHQGLYVRDLAANTTILVSARPDGFPSVQRSWQNPMISANGRYVSFTHSDDLDPNFPDAHLEPDGPFSDIFVRDLESSTTERVSLPFPGGPAEESGSLATISADGRFVAYMSRDGSLRVRDRVTDTTSAHVTAPGGVPPDGFHEFPSISEDGRLVYFGSYATNLVPGDTNGVLDAFLYIASESADLSLTLASSTTQPAQGSNVTLTVTVINSGPSDAEDVVVRVPLPPGLSFVSASGNGGYASATGVWTIDALTGGSSASLQITAQFTAPALVGVTAQVSASSVPDPDSTPDNDNASEDDQATVQLTPSLADLSLTLGASAASPAVNSNVTLTLRLTNDGPLSATGVTVRMPLPAGLTFVSASPAAYDAATGVWTLGAIPVGVTVGPGTTLGLAVVARVTSASAVDVTAQVSASSRPDPDSTPNNDNAAEDDQQTVRLTPVVTGIVVNHPGAQINANDGFCTLREAIIAANTDTPSGVPVGECAAGNGADVIHMRATPNVHTHSVVDNTVTGPSGLPVVRSEIVIEGNGATIQRSSAASTPDFRLFTVVSGGSLTLQDVTVRGGRVQDCGGGLRVESATLALVRTAVDGNTVGPAGSAIGGGGICAIVAVLSLTDSTVTANRASKTATSGGISGGGIYTATTPTTLTRSTVAGNLASAAQWVVGGGIHALFGTRLSLADSRVESNRSTHTAAAGLAAGGGIWADSQAGFPSTMVELTRTTLYRNSVTGGTAVGGIRAGGGLGLQASTAALFDSHIQNNSASAGGGVATLGANTLTITGGTVAANVADGDWAIAGGGGGIFTDVGTLASLSGVVINNNQATRGNGGGIFNRGRLIVGSGAWRNNLAVSGGGLSNGTSLMTAGPVTLTNVIIESNGVTSYGGGIFTANPPGALAAASAVTIAGGTVRNNSALSGGGIFIRRNAVVAVGGNAQIATNVARQTGGGVENDGSLNVTASTVSDNTARQSAGIHNSGTATLTGATVSRNSTNLFGGGGIGNTGRLTLLDSTVTNNRAGAVGHGGGIEQQNGGVLVLDNTTLSNNTAALGGGGLAMIFTASTATIGNNSVVSDNVSAGGEGGGGIFADSGTSLQVVDSTVRSNSAIYGGGAHSRGSVRILRSTVSENTATFGGGGVMIYGAASSLALQQSRVRANRTTGGGLGWGGGLLLGGANASIADSHVDANSSDFGGGVNAVYNSQVTIERVGISANAAGVGGGLGVAGGSSIQMRSSTLSSNTATQGGGGALFADLYGYRDVTTTLAYVTVSGNDAPTGGGLFNGGRAPTSMTASIVAGNRQNGSITGPSADCFGRISSGGTNLVGIGTGCPAAGNRTVVPADVFAIALGPLADNGGPSPTHDLLPGSPAIDIPGLLTCRFPAVSLDQRGMTRPRDGNGDAVSTCDIGAFER